MWSGVYVGIGGGAASFDLNMLAHAERNDPAHQTLSKADAHLDDDDWRGFGTIQVGYDKMVHHSFVIGVFADYDFFHDSDHGFLAQGEQNQRKFSFKGSFEIDDVWTVGGRLGYLVHPHFLIYGLAGYSQMQLDGNIDVTITEPGRPPNELALAVDDHLDCYTLGAGGEVGLHSNVSFKFEYRFSQFDGTGVSASEATKLGTTCCTFTDSASAKFDDIDEHSIRGALVLRLGDMHRREAVPLK